MHPEHIAPLTLDEHREMSQEIRKSVETWKQLCDLVVEVYGPESGAGSSFLNAMEAVSRLRQELETQAVQDFPGRDEKLYL